MPALFSGCGVVAGVMVASSRVRQIDRKQIYTQLHATTSTAGPRACSYLDPCNQMAAFLRHIIIVGRSEGAAVVIGHCLSGGFGCCLALPRARLSDDD